MSDVKAPKPIYSRAIRKTISAEIKWRDGAEKDEFFRIVEELGWSLNNSISNELADPRIGESVLDRVVGSIRTCAKELELMDQQQAETGSIRQIVSTWGRSKSGNFDVQAWDDLDDARGLLVQFADEVEKSLIRFRSQVRKSREHPDKEIAWAAEIWREYRKVHSNPKIGKRDGKAGPFRLLLERLAEPLGVDVNWTKTEWHLRRRPTQQPAREPLSP